MAKINLRDYYPSAYNADAFTETSGDVAVALAEAVRGDHSYYERRRYHRAFYSLDAGDGIENAAVHLAPSPEALFMEKLTREQLAAALDALPETQRRRVAAHFIHGMSKADIARAEGVSKNSIGVGIARALAKIKMFLE